MLAPTMQSYAPAGIHVQAPAKVNLYLRVLGTRPDGFHEIRSVAMAVGLFDDVRLTGAPQGQLRLSCRESGLPCDDRNLVIRAARALAEEAGVRAGVDIELHKRVPVAAGLGGGSSDAAATLRGLNQLWGTRLGDAELVRIGAAIGSDVPLFFVLPAARMAGRGENVQRADLRWSGWVLLIFGERPVATAEVYQRWEPTGDGSTDAREREVVQAPDARAVMAASFNDLEPAVFRVCPEVRTLHERVSSRLDRRVRVSGAGSTLFTLFDDRETAGQAVARLSRMGLSTALVGGPSKAMTNL